MKVDITPSFVLFLLLGAAVDPLGVFLQFLIAALVHEAGHFLTILFLGGRIAAIRLGFGDVRMQVGLLPRLRRLIALLAGPFANIGCFFLFAGVFPEFAVVSLLLGLFNLLPVLPLDGGRVLSLFLQGSCVLYASIFGLLLLFGGAVYAAKRLDAGLWPILTVILIILRLLFCKKADKIKETF